jgi:von Willebrand factor type A domain.
MDTHVTFVLDSSGSMSKIEDDTRGGFNIFLQEQREEEGTATVSLYQFDSNVQVVYQNRPIEEAPTLDTDNYRPGGKTALHDALTQAIDDTGDHLTGLPERKRPENVIVVVLTDGKENASETPDDVVHDRVETRRDEDDWEFLFIGANQDAALTAEKMGMDANKSLDMAHNDTGAENAYYSTSQQISEVRQTGSTDGYTEADRQRQRDADNK